MGRRRKVIKIGELRICEEIFNNMLNENYIKADKFGITTSDGNVVDLSIDLGEENKDTPFETACRKNTNCKYVCNFHRRKDYS
jgi:hypothetical protein